MVTRRLFLAGIGFGAAAMPVAAKAATPLFEVDLRGAIDASKHGIRPSAGDNKSRSFQKLLREAAAKNMPVFLPAGDYVVMARLPNDGGSREAQATVAAGERTETVVPLP